MNNDTLWQAKLHARLHDPAEKALILMRTAHGHEGGTSQKLHRTLFPGGVPEPVKLLVARADQWASAADRAAFPRHHADGCHPQWQQVDFHDRPVIIHPLTGDSIDLGRLTSIEPAQVEAVSFDHFSRLVHDDVKRTALAFWRFGPTLDAEQLKSLWALLPADTRVPDHTIWDHLDLTAAFAAAFAMDDHDGPALMSVSLGPVQEFIAASRTTSDLWAGSHLLSRFAWEAMSVICDVLGPEAILFPRLRGIPQVDLWLRDRCGLREELFSNCAWRRPGTDANPLFAAALPNRFSAIVPANQVETLASAMTRHLRTWVVQRAERAYVLLLEAAGMQAGQELPGYQQIRDQLEGFPEVQWAAVPWSIIGTKDNRVDADDQRLREAMQPFFASSPPGFLASPEWQALSREIELEAGWFWRPNPAALYPALHQTVERVLAASKTLRPFEALKQDGHRCALTGEAEWLTTDRSQLQGSYRQRKDTLWAKAALRRPAWAKKGEHLGVRAALKRMWPTLFLEELRDLDQSVQRFVVSTHTMALVTSLDKWLKEGKTLPDALAQKLDELTQDSLVALPRRMVNSLRRHPDRERLSRLPGWLQQAHEAGEAQAQAARNELKNAFGTRPETYYALLLMDGDHMGEWLAGSERVSLEYQASFHPQIQQCLNNRFAADASFSNLAKSLRTGNPARHMAISDALTNFATVLAPAIVEEQYHGRILYAGGDDVMAMLPVSELLPAMAALRAAYSGIDPGAVGAAEEDPVFKQQGNGFVLHDRRLLRVMGEKATASIGAVIAHYEAPLGMVLRELRDAERRAKHEGQRDAFSVTVAKRSGSLLRVTAKWQGRRDRKDERNPPMGCLRALRTDIEGARRASYHVRAWSVDLPPASMQDYPAMLESLLRYQFERQGFANAGRNAKRLANLQSCNGEQASMDTINGFLSLAEFLARDIRS